MRAVATLLLDSVRAMRARALFWVVLGVSALVGAMYLAIGFSDSGITLFFGLYEFEHPVIQANTDAAELLYLGMFHKPIVVFWLFGAAIFLALIATASIFPDLMAEGSIEITLAKPIGRLGLFLAKYVGSLLFMAVQVTIFVVLAFLAIRWRVGTWNPSVFWLVPLSVLVFSYLYAVVVLISVKTRSVMPGILGAAALWVVAFMLNFSDAALYDLGGAGKSNDGLYEDEIRFRESVQSLRKGVLFVNAFLPKPRQTLDIADRLVVVNGERGFSTKDFVDLTLGWLVDVDESTDQLMRRNSVAYVLGTSLAFEVVVVGLAAWIFCRRDF